MEAQDLQITEQGNLKEENKNLPNLKVINLQTIRTPSTYPNGEETPITVRHEKPLYLDKKRA